MAEKRRTSTELRRDVYQREQHLARKTTSWMVVSSGVILTLGAVATGIAAELAGAFGLSFSPQTPDYFTGEYLVAIAIGVLGMVVLLPVKRRLQLMMAPKRSELGLRDNGLETELAANHERSETRGKWLTVAGLVYLFLTPICIADVVFVARGDLLLVLVGATAVLGSVGLFGASLLKAGRQERQGPR